MQKWEPEKPSTSATNSPQSSVQGKTTLGDTVQKFRDYYKSILTHGGVTRLQKTFLAERELGKKLPPEEQATFLALIQQMEMELLGADSETDEFSKTVPQLPSNEQ